MGWAAVAQNVPLGTFTGSTTDLNRRSTNERTLGIYAGCAPFSSKPKPAHRPAHTSNLSGK